MQVSVVLGKNVRNLEFVVVKFFSEYTLKQVTINTFIKSRLKLSNKPSFGKCRVLILPLGCTVVGDHEVQGGWGGEWSAQGHRAGGWGAVGWVGCSEDSPLCREARHPPQLGASLLG